jgi:hypothetical protein
MTTALQVPEKTKGAAPDQENAPSANHSADHTSEKLIATIRAKLCHSGGRVLYRASADDGTPAFFVVSPWGQIRQFATLDEIQATLDGRPA